MDCRQLADRNLAPARSRHQHFLQRIDVRAEIAHVADIHPISGPAIDDLGHRLAADRILDRHLRRFDADALPSQFLAVPVDVEIVAVAGSLRENRSGRGIRFQHRLDFLGELLNAVRRRAGNLEAERGAHSRSQHVHAAADGHRP